MVNNRHKARESSAPASFSYNVREEVARSVPERACCREAMLASFLFSGGECPDGKETLTVTTGFSPVARLVYQLVREVSHAPVEWETEREKFFNRRKIYRINLPPTDQIREFISRWGVGHKLQRSNIRKACCRRSFLTGAFLAAGSVNSPERYYHFEIVEKDLGIAKFLVQILSRMEITGKISRRKTSNLVYVKKADEIANLLNLLGAYKCLLQFEEIRAIKETKEEVRRKVNAETANLDKTACAATRQVHNIRYLQQRGVLERLPEKLKITAQMRLRFPQASLKELGERLSPPLTKSSVNSRLRRLENLCRRMKKDDESIVLGK